MNYAIQSAKLNQYIHDDAYFIDLRDPYSFAHFHLQNFINISEEQLFHYQHLLAKNKPIYFLCYSGKRAKELCLQFRKLGYQSFYIAGGAKAFLNENKDSLF